MNLFNRDNARDLDAAPGEWGIQGSEPTNQTQSKINIVLIFLKMILKNTSPQVFKMHIIILEFYVNWWIENKWRNSSWLILLFHYNFSW